jgi:hypothetical protein
MPLRVSLRLDVRMAPEYHPTPLSGGDRKALAKELGKSRAMANILTTQSAEMRAKGEAMSFTTGGNSGRCCSSASLSNLIAFSARSASSYFSANCFCARAITSAATEEARVSVCHVCLAGRRAMRQETESCASLRLPSAVNRQQQQSHRKINRARAAQKPGTSRERTNPPRDFPRDFSPPIAGICRSLSRFRSRE